MEPENQLAMLNAFVTLAQRVLAEYLPEESGKSEKEVIAELLGILDSRELHRPKRRSAQNRSWLTLTRRRPPRIARPSRLGFGSVALTLRGTSPCDRREPCRSRDSV